MPQKRFERSEDDLRDDQPGALFVVGGYDKQRGVFGAGGAQTVAVCSHGLIPVGPFVDIGEAELPVLVRCVDADAERSRLLVFK